jgi:arylsulfatase A-like enzyme
LLWAEHRWQKKSVAYEESIRVPLVIRYPGVTAGAKQAAALVLNIGLTPTIAEAAGLTPPAGVDGSSLVRLLHETSTAWRDDVLLEHWQTVSGDTLGFHVHGTGPGEETALVEP